MIAYNEHARDVQRVDGEPPPSMSLSTNRSITSTCLQCIWCSLSFVKTSTPTASVYRVCSAGTGFPVSKVHEFVVRLPLHLYRGGYPMWVWDGDMPESVTDTNVGGLRIILSHR